MPTIYQRDGNLIIGMVVPAPIKSTLKRTPFGGLEIPASIQKLMAGINQSITADDVTCVWKVWMTKRGSKNIKASADITVTT